MIQKTYYKTKDYCKVKFSLRPENADSVAIAGKKVSMNLNTW
jgi:hypothetical protein